jgi:hypothetical protein
MSKRLQDVFFRARSEPQRGETTSRIRTEQRSSVTVSTMLETEIRIDNTAKTETKTLSFSSKFQAVLIERVSAGGTLSKTRARLVANTWTSCTGIAYRGSILEPLHRACTCDLLLLAFVSLSPMLKAT